jgi:hypothetical protein
VLYNVSDVVTANANLTFNGSFLTVGTTLFMLSGSIFDTGGSISFSSNDLSTTGSITAGSIIAPHDTLTNRDLDANHLQYLLIDGTRAMTGTLLMDNNTINLGKTTTVRAIQVGVTGLEQDGSSQSLYYNFLGTSGNTGTILWSGAAETIYINPNLATTGDISLSDDKYINFGTFGGTVGSDGVDSLDFTADRTFFSGRMDLGADSSIHTDDSVLYIKEVIPAGGTASLKGASYTLDVNNDSTTIAYVASQFNNMRIGRNGSPSGTLTEVYGVDSLISAKWVCGTVITTGCLFRGWLNTGPNYTGVIGTFQGLCLQNIDASVLGNLSAITNAYGIYIEDVKAGSKDGGGVYTDTPANAYAIKTGLGQVDFGDTLNVTGVTTLGSGNVRTIKTVTTTYPITTADYTVLGNHATTAFTITLPATFVIGTMFNIKNINDAAVTVAVSASDYIDGVLDGTVVLAKDESITVQASEADAHWRII